MMMSDSISSETPFILKFEEFDENYVRLPYERATVACKSKQYMQRRILKLKGKGTLNVDNYIIRMKQYKESVPFYMTVHNRKKITYLTSRHFSLGLLKPGPGTRHEIKNVAYSVSLYVFVCSRKERSMFTDHVNKGLALVNKTWITSFFKMRKVLPTKTCSIKSDVVYFFFAMRHSEFILERIESTSDSRATIEIRAGKVGKTRTEKTQELDVDKTKVMETEKTKELDVDKEKELDVDKTKELDVDKTEEMETEKTKEMETEKMKEMETEKTKKMETEKTKEMETEKTKEMETDKTKEMETNKTKEMETNKTKEMETEKMKEMETGKTKEMETEKTKEKEFEKTKETEIDEMEDVKEGHKDFNCSEALLNTLKKVEKLDSEIMELEVANRKLEEANQELKRENSALKNSLNRIRKRSADVDYEVQNSKKLAKLSENNDSESDTQ